MIDGSERGHWKATVWTLGLVLAAAVVGKWSGAFSSQWGEGRFEASCSKVTGEATRIGSKTSRGESVSIMVNEGIGREAHMSWKVTRSPVVGVATVAVCEGPGSPCVIATDGTVAVDDGVGGRREVSFDVRLATGRSVEGKFSANHTGGAKAICS